jgi:hypothetical protein
VDVTNSSHGRNSLGYRGGSHRSREIVIEIQQADCKLPLYYAALHINASLNLNHAEFLRSVS